MLSLNHLRIALAAASLVTLTGCNTTSQPVAQTAAKKPQKYYTDYTPQTGSHMPQRIAVDDNGKPTDPAAAADSATPTLVNPTLNGPKVAPRGN